MTKRSYCLYTAALVIAAHYNGSIRAQDAHPPPNAGVLITIHAFTGSDGGNPIGNLIADQNGTLYGTASIGGSSANAGTVFQLTPPASTGGAWTTTVLYAFSGGSDGKTPQSGLVLGNNGILYGTTFLGGRFNNGTIFQLTPPSTAGGPWTETVIHDFTGAADGAWPAGGMVINSGGSLYGTTDDGGIYGDGVVFELKPAAGGAWTYTVLHPFAAGSDGKNPVGNLALGPHGILYGTTVSGGPANAGTVFQVLPPATAGGAWTETVLYSFTGGADGGTPYAGVVRGRSGALYGTTWSGGASGTAGTVYQLKPPASAGGAWIETVLHSFSSGDGAAPYAALTFGNSGVLYGTTSYNGPGGDGVAFALQPPAAAGGAWTETVLYGFAPGPNGHNPNGLLFRNGLLYGTTNGGKTSNGTVFQLTP